MRFSSNCGDTPCAECTDCVEPIETACPPKAIYLEDPTIDSSNIKYLGENDDCIPATKFSSLSAFFNNIITFVKSRLFGITSVSLAVTNPTNNNCNKLLNIELVPSSNAGNILVLGTDGKPFVPATSIQIQGVNIANGNCITFQKSVVNGIITFTPTIDITCLAEQVCVLCEPIVCGTPSNLQIS